MAYYIIIRGPLGCGKSTIARELSKKLNAEHISIDNILEKNNLLKEWEEGYISQKSFFEANKIAVKEAKKLLDKGKIVIFDGNFYWKSQIDDLIARLNYSNHIFTLKAPLDLCIERELKRGNKLGMDAAEAVYKKSNSFTQGTIIDATQTISKIVKKILSYLPR